MKKLAALLLALVLCVALTACGPDRQPAIDAFNEANTLFNEVAGYMNENPDEFDDESFQFMNDFAEVIAEHKALLEGDQELTEEKLAEMIEWYGTVKDLMIELKAEIGLE